jgi:hypothetical protein
MHQKPFVPSSMRKLLNNEEYFNSFLKQNGTVDGLLPSSKIQIKLFKTGYELLLASRDEIPIFSVRENHYVVDVLVKYPQLWDQSALRLSFAPSINGSIQMFGVPFQRAVEIALARGYVKSQFYYPDQGAHSLYKTLLLHLNRTQDNRGLLIQLEAWHYTPGDKYAYYVHALSPDFKDQIYHLDGATIFFTESDLNVLLMGSKKIKGTRYTKYFRLDGSFSVDQMHSIVRSFFPCLELYDEAFEIHTLDHQV